MNSSPKTLIVTYLDGQAGSRDAEYGELLQEHKYLAHVFDDQRDGLAGHRVAVSGVRNRRVLDDAEHEHDEPDDGVGPPEQQAQYVRPVQVADQPTEFVASGGQP